MAEQSAGSIVGDVRRLLQDLVTPDLKALAARVDGLDKQLDALKQDVQLVKQDVQLVKQEMQLVRQDVHTVRAEVIGTRDKLEAAIQQLNERQERRFDRLISALDVYKEVQDLKEFRIRTEERLKASA